MPLGVAGVAGVGGTAGVGVSAGTFLVDNQTRASIGAAADVAAAGAIGVRGTRGAGCHLGRRRRRWRRHRAYASAAVNDYNPLTYAWIGDGARINQGVSGAAAGRSLAVHAARPHRLAVHRRQW